MKFFHSFTCYALCMLSIGLLGFGCSSLLEATAKPTSMPVLSGAATTNDPVAIAYEKMALSLNAQYNTSASEPLIAGIGGALLALTSAFGGWYSRHHTANHEIAATKAATDATNGKT